MSQKHALGKFILANKEGAYYRRAVLCYEGTFEGVYGEVTVTELMLLGLANRYNEEHANPVNENDFAPILINHDRDVDKVKGRIMGDLSVEDWVHPATGKTVKALFGSLRIDEEDAQAKAEKGTYSQLSISFDEETFELYEVSFVAVEAARRSQLLEKGERSMSVELQKQVADLQKNLSAKKAKIKTILANKKTHSLAAKAVLEEADVELGKLTPELGKLLTNIRSVALKAEFRKFLLAGKMNKAEFDAFKFEELAALPEVGITTLLKSFEGRTVTSDAIQHGQQGAKPVDLSKMSKADIRKAAELQRQGKTSLAEGDEPGDSKNKDSKDQGGEGDGGKKSSDMPLSYDDVKETIGHVEALKPLVDKISASMKRMGDSLAKLMEQDEEGEDDNE